MAAEQSTREVITLQVGNYSNFVGAHFWNLQESLLSTGPKHGEINHGVLYREGRVIGGGRAHKYKPRAICLDLKGSFANFQRNGEPPDEHDTPTWDGTVEKYNRGPDGAEKTAGKTQGVCEKFTYLSSDENQQKASQQSQSLNTSSFEDSIASWLDYSLARFHDKSFNVIEGVSNDSQSFVSFGNGERLFHSRKFQDSFEDSLHFFAEECDRLQGFQIFSDIHDSFGGLTSNILEDIVEEYPKKTRLCFPTMPAVFPEETRYMADARLLNTLLGLSRYISGSSSHVVPLSLRNSFGLRSKPVDLPWIEYQPCSSYHTSAILASAIDTATLSGRLTSPTTSRSFIGILPPAGDNKRNISALSIGLPTPISNTYNVGQLLNSYEEFGGQFCSLTPDVAKPTNIMSETTTLRGLPTHIVPKSVYQVTERQLNSLLRPFMKYRAVLCSIIEQPCLLTPLYPDIFKPCVTSVGCVTQQDQAARAERQGVHKTSVMTRLQCCEEIGELLNGLMDAAKKANIKKQPCFVAEGIEDEDFSTTLEELDVAAQAYCNKYEL